MWRSSQNHKCRVVDVVAIPIGIATSHRAEVVAALFIVCRVVETGI